VGDPDDSDIRRELEQEQRHARYRTRVRRWGGRTRTDHVKTVPMWAWTSGTWAVLFIVVTLPSRNSSESAGACSEASSDSSPWSLS